jgi:hypothetical protein
VEPVVVDRVRQRGTRMSGETRIGRALLAGQVRDGATITVDVEDEEPVVHRDEPAKVLGEPGQDS